MAVNRSAVEVEVLAERLERLAVLAQESYGTDVAVVRAPFDERYAAAVRGVRGVTL